MSGLKAGDIGSRRQANIYEAVSEGCTTHAEFAARLSVMEGKNVTPLAAAASAKILVERGLIDRVKEERNFGFIYRYMLPGQPPPRRQPLDVSNYSYNELKAIKQDVERALQLREARMKELGL